jgi:predicted PurR-regulated permease PerM
MAEPTVKSYARETAISTSILAVIALLTGLFVGRVVFMPIVLALTLTTLFRPPVRWLEKQRVPATAGAPLVVIITVVLLITAGRFLAPSASTFASMIPKALIDVRHRLAALPAPINGVRRAIPYLPTADSDSGTATDSGKAAIHRPPPTIAAQGSLPAAPPAISPDGDDPFDLGPVAARLFGTATDLISTFLQTSVLLIFLLIGSDDWQRTLRKRSHPFARQLVEIGDIAQDCVSRYLAMTGLINVGQGILVSLAAWAIGLPSPIIWGVLTFFAEFLPYLGGFAMVALLTLVGFATSQSFGHALLGPVAYLIVTTVQNNVVSPIVYGRGLELNPAAILISVIVWLFLWGVVGAFLAVPILAIIKIVCERAGGGFEPVSELIAG